jgi:hypothetical protein
LINRGIFLSGCRPEGGWNFVLRSPAYSFAGVGPYEVIRGYATGEVDPSDQLNSVMTDITLAPTNTKGHVVHVHNFYILKPLELSKGNQKVMYEPVNRGNKTFGVFNNTPTFPITNDPASLIDPTAPEDSFLWARGYTTVWSRWEYEGDPTDANNLNESAAGVVAPNMVLTSLPVAYSRGNTTLTGPGYEYIVQTTAT